MKQKLNLQLLIFKISDRFFAIESRHIKEIVENTESFPIPIETQHIKRIFLHRNEAIGILDTNYYFETGIKKENYFLVLEKMIAIPAEELGGIFSINQFEKKEKIKSPFINKVFYINDQLISVIDYKEIISHEGKTVLYPI